MSGTRGVVLVGLILEQLSVGKVTAAAIAEAKGVPRSSVFEVVRRLEHAGIVSRRHGGQLAPGPVVSRLGFAAFGLGALHGQAQALLRLLRDDTDGTATLRLDDTTLVHMAGRGVDEGLAPTFEAKIGAKVSLSLTLPAGAARGERSIAAALFEQVTASLESTLIDDARRQGEAT
jgi:DNA-binding IclR family transcriptional regulator